MTLPRDLDQAEPHLDRDESKQRKHLAQILPFVDKIIERVILLGSAEGVVPSSRPLCRRDSV
jgi:hypothetical protein